MWGRIMTFFSSRGEGTAWDLDYGKLIIIGLCIYIAIYFPTPKRTKRTKLPKTIDLPTPQTHQTHQTRQTQPHTNDFS